MSEESPESFSSGDVVWVKLGSSWWPGEVKDLEELPNDILDFKKPPLVIAKFFDEDSYEYIKSWSNIYPYNCEKKNEFIKKGMAAFRGKVPHMDKFPKDVLTAESKVGGNPNILSDPMFLPDKKRNYAAEIFGTPSPKVKANKDKKRANAKSSQKNTAHITHRRFLGVDDYRAYICIQYPGKDRVPGDREDEEVLRINREPEQEFNCHTCSFTTKRLEVMILHTKSHIQGVYVSSPRKKKQSAVRKKKEKTKKSRNVSDVIESESSSDSEPVRERKRKPKSQSSKAAKVKKTEEKEKPKQSIDIRNELLAVWDDSNDDDDEFDISLDKLGKSQKLSQSTLEGVLSGTIVDSADESLHHSMDDKLNKPAAVGAAVEETLEQIRAEVRNPSEGEVANLTEAPNQDVEDALTSQSVEEALDKSVVELLSQSETLHQAIEETLSQSTEKSAKKKTMLSGHSAAKGRKESTAKSTDQLLSDKISDDRSTGKETVDEWATDKETEKAEKKMDRDIQEAIKSCFDFDEDDEEDNAIVSKAAVGGRKIPRVIPLAERRKSKDIIEEDMNRDKILKGGGSSARKKVAGDRSEEADAAFKELMDVTEAPELPEPQNTLKCEQNFHNIKTIKFPDKPESVGSPPKVTKTEKKDSNEVATKLTNPKKRFVKSFEDFELMQNEIRRKEEQDERARIEEMEPRPGSVEEKSHSASSSVVLSNYEDFDASSKSPSDACIELCKLKSKIMSKIIEEANINEESKSKIMAKMQEPEAESKRHSYSENRRPEKLHSTVGHRTPRSKILESYMKDTNNQKDEKHKKERAEQQLTTGQSKTDASSNNIEEIVEGKKKEAATRKNVVPPKKNKWSRRGSHPKKDRNLFLLEDIRPDDPSVKEARKEDEPIKFDSEETAATLEALNKTPTISSEGVDEFTPFSTNNETILAKELLVMGIHKGLEETSSKLSSAEKETEEILARQEDALSECKETDKASSVNEETDTLSALREEPEKMPLNDDETETDLVCLSAEDQENDGFSSKDDEPKKMVFNVEEKDEATSKDREIEKSSLKESSADQDCDRLFSKDEEPEKASLNLEDSYQGTPEDEEIQKSPVRDVEIQMSNLKDEIGKLSVTDVETGNSFLKDKEIEESSLKDGEIKRSPLKDVEFEHLSLNDAKTGKLLSNDETPHEAPSKEIEMSLEIGQTVELSREEVPEQILENQISDESSAKPENDEWAVDQEAKRRIEHTEGSGFPLKELDHSPVTENEVGSLPLVDKEPLNSLEDQTELIITEECEIAAVEESVKWDTNECNSDKIESVSEEQETIPLNNADFDQDNCIVPPYQPTIPIEGGRLNVASEEVSSASPSRDVSVPMDTISSVSPTKSMISAPRKKSTSLPKKSKKRKASDSDMTKTDDTEFEVDIFSPSGKRKKEIDFKDHETTLASEKVDSHSGDFETTDANRECFKPEIVDDTAVNESDMKINIATERNEEATDALTTGSVEKLTDHSNEVEIQCASSSVESFRFSIQTNLSNLTSREEMSALALATLSEIKADLESSDRSLSEIGYEQPEIREELPEVKENQLGIREELPDVREELVEIEGEQPEITEQPEILEQHSEIKENQVEIGGDLIGIREEQPEIVNNQPEIMEQQPELKESQVEIREELADIRGELVEVGGEQPEIIEEQTEIKENQLEIREELPDIRGELVEAGGEQPEIIEEQPEIKENQVEIREELPDIREKLQDIREELPIRREQSKIREIQPEIREKQPEVIKVPLEIRKRPPEIRKERPELKVEPEKSRPAVLPMPVHSEMVPIEGNLTVVSEKDLADGQVEITTEKVISSKKPITLSNFSMDFSDSGSDSNSTNDIAGDASKSAEFASKGTEFTSKAMTKQIKRLNKKKENAYERLELLNILEGNSDSEKKPKEYHRPPKKTVMEDICDFEEHIPSQIVCAKGLKRGLVDTEGDFIVKEKSQKMSDMSTASKLLERLTESKTKVTPTRTNLHSEMNIPEGKFPTKIQITPSATKQTRYNLKSKTPATSNRPVILSEQIIKPASETKKPKRMLNDIEDVEAFVIHKDPRKNKPDEEDNIVKTIAVGKSAGKAKILQQTIITPAGEIIQPTVNQMQTDDNIFDINSMPIVLSDELLTPESIENMPIVIGTETKPIEHEKPIRRPTQGRIITKTIVTTPQPILNRTHTITKHSKPPRILQTVGSKIVKNSPLLPNTAKPGKYIIVPQSSNMAQNKFISKKTPIAKRSPVPTGVLSKVPNIAPEPSGNKIMIVTNQQGQQQRLLLTPAQQKMLGYQNQKVTKTVMKGNMLQKSVLATKSSPLIEAGTSGVMSKSPSLVGQKIMVATNSSPLITTTSHQVIHQGRTVKNVAKRVTPTTQKVFPSGGAKQKTILIKNQHGQTVRKIQGTDDELLDKQVAEQLEAIKASSGMKFSSQPKQTETYKMTPKSNVRRSYSKKIEVKPKLGPPPLTGIHQSPKPDKIATPTFPPAKKSEPIEVKQTPPPVPEPEAKSQPDRPLNQLVIQDAVGNQTTITEGQILALPSETVDGQPQSYMLVTLDESGNLTPLNSEALMSLDPNLGLGGDLSNMVLQIDQGALTDRPQTIPIKTTGASELAKTVMVESATTMPVPEASITTEITESPVVEQKMEPVVEMPQAIVPSTNGDPGQQLIVTGDPIATQKFLESLTEGTTDLANILANADGNSILIQADGQQILINTNSDNQMLLSMNNDTIGVSESTEGGGNPIFATQPNKNQDILAAALADTDVFQQEQHSTQGKITSQLSPSNTLYPMNVGSVLETSLTLSSPIMTPLEVPSTNSKRIPDDEADILTRVPKNVDLPITITDPNISQTVANQQLIANELHTNLELTLPISETTMSAVSTEMNSPSYVYSLPSLDDSVDITQKPFNSSMPLLNEDVEDSGVGKIKPDEDGKLNNDTSHDDDGGNNKSQAVTSEGCFLEEEEGRFTLGGEMCSSLSEPPPEMFDLPESTSDASDNTSKEDDTTDLSTQADTSSEGSCEIPLQPQIVTKSLDLSRNLDSLKRSMEGSGSKGESKKCKFD